MSVIFQLTTWSVFLGKIPALKKNHADTIVQQCLNISKSEIPHFFNQWNKHGEKNIFQAT